MAATDPLAGPETVAPSGADNRWVRMAGSIFRTAVSVAVTILGLLALTFFIGRLLPLDPVLAILGDDASQDAYQRMFVKLGLDRPLWEQFLTYIGNSLTVDFGTSLTSGNPVTQDILRVFPATLELATVAMILGTGLGIPLGVMAAANRDTWIDQTVRIVSLIGYSAPIFWLGLLGLTVFYAGLGWVGAPGRIDIVYQYDLETRTGLYLIDSILAGRWDIFQDVFSRIVLPASILAYGAMAYIARMTRSFMLEQFGQEYIIAARAKGATRWQVIWSHAFPNIAVQLVTVVALSYAFLLEGAVLTETVFAWPGFGRYLTTALLRADMNAVLGCTLIVGLIFIVLNLASDIFYRVFDPRTR